MSLTLVFIAKDDPGLDEFDQTHIPPDCDFIGIGNTSGRPLSALANEILDKTRTDVFGLCHADAIFGPGALEAFTAEAMCGAVCGIVGRDMAGVYRCSWLDSRDSWWSEGVLVGGPGPVSTLDGMAVFFHTGMPLRFDDATFDGFHCHVEDLCLQAHAAGIPVTVPRSDAQHRNHAQNPKWLEQYHVYRRRLEAKWKGTEFRTT